MLNINRQYGVAASSSIVRVVHPEDIQPNEVIQNKMLPPKLNTIRAPHFDHTSWNHSRPMTQVARRGTRNPRLSRPHVETFPNSTDVPINLPTATATQSSVVLAPDRSISPKLPPSPIRRRMPQDPPQPIDLDSHHHHYHRPSSPPPLPSRQRKQRDIPLSDLPSYELTTHHDLLIKRETHSTEPVLPSRKLVTEACTFLPLPENCRKSALEYSQSRKGFTKAKVSELARYGLKTTRTFFRDDGLVIEWRSDIPVWNDTFLPEKPTTVATNSKRKRDVIVDASNSAQRPGRLYKRQKELKHWSTGLSMAEVRKLGRDVEANLSNHSPQPPLSGQSSGSQGINWSSSAVTSPKRTALPTRLTPSERNEISNFFSQKASSSPLRHGQLATIAVSADTNSPKLTTSSNADRLNSPNSPADNNLDPSVARLLADAFGSVKETYKLTDPNNATSVDPPGSINVDSVFTGAEKGRPIEELLRRGGSGEVYDAPTQFSCTNPQQMERAGVVETACADIPEYEMAEDFLRRFIHDFDTDRNKLRSAYSNDALLSCRSVPSVTSVNSDSASIFPSPSTHFGRTEIMNQLNKLTNCYFSMPSNAIYYDVAVLSQEVITLRALNRSIDKNAVGGILATLHSQIIRYCGENEGLEQTMSLHQSFVLRRRTETDEADEGNGVDGPMGEGGSSLIVVSHHMILRDEPLLRPDQVSKLMLSFPTQDLLVSVEE